MKFNLMFALSFLLSCADHKEQNRDSSGTSGMEKEKIATIQKDTLIQEESFTDSTLIGKRKMNKVEVFKYRTTDSNYVEVKLYTRQNGLWQISQNIRFPKDGPDPINPEISDFNNDKLNDLTIVSASAARGANEIRRLFIFDKSLNKLIEIKNAQSYPNLLYNKEKNCIDAFLVYGGSSTVFLKLKGDSLQEFAVVDAWDGVTVRMIDEKGNEKVTFRDTSNKAAMVRFKNFNPLKVYKEGW